VSARDRLGTLAVVALLLVLGGFAGSALSQWRRAPEGGGGFPEGPRERVRVEVLNGGGREGMARAATDALRDEGFDVVFYGNAAAFDRDSSLVLDRVGRPDLARAAADALGIPRVLSRPDSNLYLDVTVLLGGDWSPAPRPVEPPADAARRPWWDPREWPRPGGGAPPRPIADPAPRGH
jgi:hypothetical protein